MTEQLGTIAIGNETDALAARRRARDLACSLGFDSTDQVRVATAVSELGRLVGSSGGGARLELSVRHRGSRPELVITARPERALATAPTGDVTGLTAIRRLMDEVNIGDDGSITLVKTPSTGHRPLSRGNLTRLRDQLARPEPASAMDELRREHDAMLGTLAELQATQDQLMHLNEELHETNRGVVALYAELDERGEQLEAANDAKSRFLANVSHELRSPLNSISGLAQLLREPDSDPLTAAQDNQVRLIAQACTELLVAVNGLLDMARAESGVLQPELATVDVRSMLDDMRATLRPLTAPDVELVVRVDGDVGRVQTDPVLLAHLIRNLASNALKYTEHGTVTIAVTRDSAALRIEVSDTGIGVAPEHQSLVFEEFFRVPGHLQVRTRGTGLGLPYARRVAEALGGSLTMTSEHGAGSVFTATIPAPVAAAGAPAPTLSTVVIGDDDPACRELLRGLLGARAGTVVEAEDSAGVLAAMAEHDPDLVLLDLNMPGGGGEQVLATAAVDDRLHPIPIVVVSSARDGLARVSALEGAPVTVDKADLGPDVLFAAIARAVAARGEGG